MFERRYNLGKEASRYAFSDGFSIRETPLSEEDKLQTSLILMHHGLFFRNVDAYKRHTKLVFPSRNTR